MAEYIDRNALMADLNRFAPGGYSERVALIIGKQPAADVAPVRHGRWTITDTSIENAVCSCCGKHFQSYYGAYSYCPNCGAKMDREGEENG